jgi:hypothetical protein
MSPAKTHSGPGPRRKLQTIFDTFHTTKEHGTGLGLSIARTIVETYGGKICTEVAARGGAVLRFTLRWRKLLVSIPWRLRAKILEPALRGRPSQISIAPTDRTILLPRFRSLVAFEHRQPAVVRVAQLGVRRHLIGSRSKKYRARQGDGSKRPKTRRSRQHKRKDPAAR